MEIKNINTKKLKEMKNKKLYKNPFAFKFSITEFINKQIINSETIKLNRFTKRIETKILKQLKEKLLKGNNIEEQEYIIVRDIRTPHLISPLTDIEKYLNMLNENGIEIIDTHHDYSVFGAVLALISFDAACEAIDIKYYPNNNVEIKKIKK